MIKDYKHPTGFHWRDGWYFDRQPDGSVEVRYEPTAHLFTNDAPTVTIPATQDCACIACTIRFTIPPNEWASIVTSVSKDGETYDRWMAAQEFHGREE